jgi:nucleoside-diphosphate-sugar epimerase
MSDTPPPLVLVTGSAGRLGRAAVRGLLDAGCRVRGFDRIPSPAASEWRVGELQDTAALAEVTRGVAAIVHLAATPDDGEAPDFFVRDLVPNNIVGLHHLLEAARLNGVPRLVLASSGQVNWFQQYGGKLPIRAEDPITPRHWYAATKVFMESVGFSYAQTLGRTVIAVRLGWCPRKGQAPEIAANATAQDLYLSPGDAGRFFARAAIAAIPQGFHVLYAASLPLREPIFDLEPAMRLLDWKPLEQWPTGAEDQG